MVKNIYQREKSQQAVEIIRNAKSISILPSKVGGQDPYCAGVGLYHALKDNSQAVQLIYQGKIPEGCEELVPAEEVVSDIKNKELFVEIDYNNTYVEKVQYSSDDGVFVLKLGPIDKSFDLNRVRAEVRGHKSDVFLILGAQEIEDLGQTYRELEKDILTGSIINIDNTERNRRWGHYNIVDPMKDSTSLLAMNTLISWNYTIGSRSAAAFLKGVSHKNL